MLIDSNLYFRSRWFYVVADVRAGKRVGKKTQSRPQQAHMQMNVRLGDVKPPWLPNKIIRDNYKKESRETF